METASDHHFQSVPLPKPTGSIFGPAGRSLEISGETGWLESQALSACCRPVNESKFETKNPELCTGMITCPGQQKDFEDSPEESAIYRDLNLGTSHRRHGIRDVGKLML